MKKKLNLKLRDKFYDEQITAVREAMSVASVGTDEYNALLETEKKLQAEKKKTKVNINWDLVFRALELTVKAGSCIVLPVILASWMYSEDAELKLKNRNISEILSKALKIM